MARPMMKTIKESIARSLGVSEQNATNVFLVLAGLTMLSFLLLEKISSLFAFALGGSLGLTALVIEILVLRARKLAAYLELLAPVVANSFASSFSVGATLLEAFEDLANNGPKEIRAIFRAAVDDLDKGQRVSDLLSDLSLNFGSRYFDLVFLTLRTSDKYGNAGTIVALKDLAGRIRLEQTMNQELRAKQQWVGSTARLAVAAPWLVVLLLSMRPEARLFYESHAGITLLVAGLVVSIIAYRAVAIIGRLPLIPRVFA